MSAGSGFGDADAKRIIDRAAEIDAERGQRLDALANPQPLSGGRGNAEVSFSST